MKFDVYDKVKTKDGKLHAITRKIPSGTPYIYSHISVTAEYNRYCLDDDDTFIVSENDIIPVYELCMIKPGMAVKVRDGRVGVIETRCIINEEDEILHFNAVVFENGGHVSMTKNDYTYSDGYKECLEHSKNSKFDIVEIYSYQEFGTSPKERFSKFKRKLLYKVPEIPEFTPEELLAKYNELTGSMAKLKEVCSKVKSPVWDYAPTHPF